VKALRSTLIVVASCVGTLGAAGFDSEPEPGAWPLFASGLALLVAGGLWERRARYGAPGAPNAAGAGAGFGALLERVRGEVTELDEGAGSLPADSVRRRIDTLLAGDYFDLTRDHEEVARELGFAAYARVFEGVAGAERLLARSWSMLTDGHEEEGLAELPRARRHLEAAVRELEAVTPPRS